MKKMNRLLQGAEYKLAALKQHAEKLNVLSHKIRPFLPEEWSDACQVSRITESCITISTSEQASLTLLRFMQPQLLKQIKSITLLKSIHEIQFVYVPLHRPETVPHPLPTISQDVIDSCYEAAKASPKPLQKALKQLAKTLQNIHK